MKQKLKQDHVPVHGIQESILTWVGYVTRVDKTLDAPPIESDSRGVWEANEPTR